MVLARERARADQVEVDVMYNVPGSAYRRVKRVIDQVEENKAIKWAMVVASQDGKLAFACDADATGAINELWQKNAERE